MLSTDIGANRPARGPNLFGETPPRTTEAGLSLTGSTGLSSEFL